MPAPLPGEEKALTSSKLRIVGAGCWRRMVKRGRVMETRAAVPAPGITSPQEGSGPALTTSSTEMPGVEKRSRQQSCRGRMEREVRGGVLYR